ncbi:DUF5107 domain-containing protein [Chryseolinea lacunae]|uniref:DUF5107 domain-containing protein n=1 Tax=Chryseolinea lacunae TaxID=2801331 RepID=A0ABS1L1D3_9BACT|nr:DUF5107 domain-containing protein [Chryseolinea lacunae]MBL0745518.1 DUF5107 domain-containing protein [Chryseolinea lacunae]
MERKTTVEVWEEQITIPTYGIGKPEKNPIFSEKRVYQGSSGVVYPNPVIEKILDKKSDKTYHAVFLENQYIKIMILPEIGGRVQMAYDKIRQRHFIYYNQVIKPALVGLTGPWISGGIEFNWPQHHRPSTFDPIDFTIEHHDDGSKTVWVSEVEKMFHTKGMAGFRLYADKDYLEINVKLYNRTPFPQTFLWWANPALKVNDHYQSVFPPDVHAVFDHGKRDVSEFPIARGEYYKVDYSAGVDISRYKNIPVPTSYMAQQSKYDFVGGYEHDTRAGIMHVANHHVSPGKKQWTWGNGEFGFAWDRNLTDEDGPYVELMTGVFTDNQPDFSWIQPDEERTFTQYFLPYSELGVVKNATKDALVNVDIANNTIQLKFYATARYENAVVSVKAGAKEIFSEAITISPSQPYQHDLPLNDTVDTKTLTASLSDAQGKVLVQFQPEKEITKTLPDPAKAAAEPEDISSIEELFLTGLHIEQYRHATFLATDYYQEALRREPKDVRNNHAMGMWFLKRGQFAKAEKYFRQAIATLTERNANPYDGEPYFNLGLCLFIQERYDEAYEAWFKSAWNAPMQSGAYLNLARIDVREGNLDAALDLIDKSLTRNYASQTARHLKIIILRKLNRLKEAQALIDQSLALDKFSFGILFESFLVADTSSDHHSANALDTLIRLARNNIHTYVEYAFDYAYAGQYEEAIQLLNTCDVAPGEENPMTFYYMGYFASCMNEPELALQYYKQAEHCKPDYCFPNRIDDVVVLQHAMQTNNADAKAPYYLGNFWYAHKQYTEAIQCWETSVLLDATFATANRNLALAYHNKQNNPQKALTFLERAFALNPTDARVFMELDQLHKKMNHPHADRLALLEKHIALTEDRDDLYLERITLYNLLKDHRKALDLLTARQFHPWEGGEGKVVGQYLMANIALAKSALAQGDPDTALKYLDATVHYPHFLGEGKIYGTQENDINYLRGCAYEALNDNTRARDYFQKASTGLSQPGQAIFYNDQQPDKIFYQGLAHKKLGNRAKAEAIFNNLIIFGTTHIDSEIKLDYFAVSLPDLAVFDQDLSLQNKIHCHYLLGLGYLGQGNESMALHHFNDALKHNNHHAGVLIHKEMIGKSQKEMQFK